jgi:hypothetical protein
MVDNLGMKGRRPVNKFPVIPRGGARFPLTGKAVGITSGLSPGYPERIPSARSDAAMIRAVIPVIPSAYYDNYV